MTPRKPSFGFRIVGNTAAPRRLVNAATALAGYACLDTKAETDRESYLSAFWFGADFQAHLAATGSPKGYDGVCWAPFVWWDIDHPTDMERALREARALAVAILYRYPSLDEDELLLFFSGSKGYHIGLPTWWGPAAALNFNRVARRFAERFAELADVTVDASIYDKVRAFRAPNSRHPKTGLHKRRLSHDELMGLSVEGIRRLAAAPEPFEVPSPGGASDRAAADWLDAVAWVRQQPEGQARHRDVVAKGTPTLNRQTRDFIRDGAGVGDRHRLLFSAAANLAEFPDVPSLAHALLTEPARDIGLSPSDVRRQIDCGLKHGSLPKGGNSDA